MTVGFVVTLSSDLGLDFGVEGMDGDCAQLSDNLKMMLFANMSGHQICST